MSAIARLFRGAICARNVCNGCGALNGLNSPHVGHVTASHCAALRDSSFFFARPLSCVLRSPKRFLFAGALSPCTGLACVFYNGEDGNRSGFQTGCNIGINGHFNFNFSIHCLCRHNCCDSRDASLLSVGLFTSCVNSRCRTRFLFAVSGVGVTRGNNVASSRFVARPRGFSSDCSSDRLPAVLSSG